MSKTNQDRLRETPPASGRLFNEAGEVVNIVDILQSSGVGIKDITQFGTTAERNAAFAADPTLRSWYNTTLGYLEWYNPASAQWEQDITPTGGAMPTEPRRLGGEEALNTTAEIHRSNPKCNPTVFDESDEELTISADAAATLFAVYVNESPDQPLEIRDGTDNTGTLKYTIPSGAAAGARFEFHGPIFTVGIFADIAAAATTGNFTFEWWPYTAPPVV